MKLGKKLSALILTGRLYRAAAYGKRPAACGGQAHRT